MPTVEWPYHASCRCHYAETALAAAIRAIEVVRNKHWSLYGLCSLQRDTDPNSTGNAVGAIVGAKPAMTKEEKQAAKRLERERSVVHEYTKLDGG